MKVKSWVILATCALASIWLGACRVPPIPMRICPTSSFGSWREGHLHAGIDLSTAGRTGIPILAIDTCWVWRLNVWNEGYGKAIYTVLDDGMVAVYGHLSRFEDLLEDIVLKEQDAAKRYEVAIYNQPWAIKFAPGDTLGYTGATGWGPAHLHFELRSGMYQHSNIDPSTYCFDLSDQTSPRIVSVRIIPLDPQSCINGIFDTVCLKPARIETLYIQGRFGIEVCSYDRGVCGRRLAPQCFEVLVDTIKVWEIELTTFPFSRRHYSDALYCSDNSSCKGSWLIRLFDRYGLDFSGFRLFERERGIIGDWLSPGLHELEIRVGDAWGNWSSLSIPFKYGTFPSFTDICIEEDTPSLVLRVTPFPSGALARFYRVLKGKVEPLDAERTGNAFIAHIKDEDLSRFRCLLSLRDGFERQCQVSLVPPSEEDSLDVEVRVKSEFVEVLLTTPVPPLSLPSITIYEEISSQSAKMKPAGYNLFRYAYKPKGNNGVLQFSIRCHFSNRVIKAFKGILFAKAYPGRSVIIPGKLFSVAVKLPKDASIRTLVSVTEDVAPTPEGFDQCIGLLKFEPKDMFFDEPAEITIVSLKCDSLSHCGVFSRGSNGLRMECSLDSLSRFHFSTHTFKDLLILRDTQPPVIEKPHRAWVRSDGRLALATTVTDTGAGVDSRTITVYINDEIAVTGYDPDTGLIESRTIKHLRDGSHRVRLEAKDKVGNPVKQEYPLIFKPQR